MKSFRLHPKKKTVRIRKTCTQPAGEPRMEKGIKKCVDRGKKLCNTRKEATRVALKWDCCNLVDQRIEHFSMLVQATKNKLLSGAQKKFVLDGFVYKDFPHDTRMPNI
jgi:hypothetical protein